MVHASKSAKRKLRGKSKRQLLALLMYVMTILAVSNPRAYHSIEKRMGLKKKLSKRKGRKSSRSKGHKKSKAGKKSRKAKKHKGKGRPKKGQVPPQLRPYLFKRGHKPVRKKKR